MYILYATASHALCICKPDQSPKSTMQWSAQHAVNAYLQTLAMVKLQGADTDQCERMVEPKCMELISAMAAGRQAKLMLEITTMQGIITPFTVALAVAAKHTGGQLLCINLADDDTTTAMETHADFVALGDNVTFLGGTRAKEILRQLKDVEFVAIDCKLQDHIGLLRNVDFSLNGWTAVAYNMGHDHESNDVHGSSTSSLLSQALYRDGGIRWIPSLTLPIGEGVELIRYGSASKSRRRNRFYVTVED